MKFWICPPNNIVCVDDADVRVDLSGFTPANIYLVSWDGDDGTILYKDRLGIREKIIDPSPYQTWINKWMLAAQSGATTPTSAPTSITVAQARDVKSQIADVLFNMKRQKPIISGGQSWDASDESVSSMQTTALVGSSDAAESGMGGLVAQINAAFAEFNANVATFNYNVSGFNEQIAAFNSNVVGFNSVNGTFSNSYGSTIEHLNTGYVDGINSGIASSSVTTTTSSSISDGSVSSSSSSTFHGGSMGHQTMSPSTLAVLQTLNGTSPNMPTMPAIPGSGPAGNPTMNALKDINDRRNSLKTSQNQHKNNLASINTVPGVAAYDITAGW